MCYIEKIKNSKDAKLINSDLVQQHPDIMLEKLENRFYQLALLKVIIIMRKKNQQIKKLPIIKY